MNSDDIRGRSSEFIEEPMKSILEDLLGTNEKCRIVVTGYYPIVSAQSNFDDLVYMSTILNKAYKAEFVGTSVRENYIANSQAFYEGSMASLINAIKKADGGANRVQFAPVSFGADRCYGTSESWLWKLVQTDPPRTDDELFDCRAYFCNPVDIMNKINAFGHPNVEGASEYNRSIIENIGNKWPEWLHPTVLAFDVSPTSLTSGESVTIDYSVSGNQGSGLTQVELWRKNETSDWREIVLKRNTLSGENGPFSGSFTDSPPAPGTYWYGVHVVDNAGNWNDERNSNTNYQPESFEPIEVEVIETSPNQGSITCDSAEAKSWFERGVALYDQFDYTEAIDCFDEATKICPQYEEAWSMKGDAYLIGRFGFFSDNNPTEAIRCYDEALKINPRNETVWNNKGTAFNDLRQYDEAIKCYDQALNINPQYAEAWYGKGHSQYNQGNYDGALQSLEMAIALYPDIPDFWYEKGVVLEALGSDEAQAAFNKAEELETIHKPIRETEGAVAYD